MLLPLHISSVTLLPDLDLSSVGLGVEPTTEIHRVIFSVLCNQMKNDSLWCYSECISIKSATTTGN